jgi:hypothetical protein
MVVRARTRPRAVRRSDFTALRLDTCGCAGCQWSSGQEGSWGVGARWRNCARCTAACGAMPPTSATSSRLAEPGVGAGSTTGSSRVSSRWRWASSGYTRRATTPTLARELTLDHGIENAFAIGRLDARQRRHIVTPVRNENDPVENGIADLVIERNGRSASTTTSENVRPRRRQGRRRPLRRRPLPPRSLRPSRQLSNRRRQRPHLTRYRIR